MRANEGQYGLTSLHRFDNSAELYTLVEERECSEIRFLPSRKETTNLYSCSQYLAAGTLTRKRKACKTQTRCIKIQPFD